MNILGIQVKIYPMTQPTQRDMYTKMVMFSLIKIMLKNFNNPYRNSSSTRNLIWLTNFDFILTETLVTLTSYLTVTLFLQIIAPAWAKCVGEGGVS